MLTPQDIPFSVVNKLEDLTTDPHLESVKFWEMMAHPTEGLLRIPRNPITMSATPPTVTRLPPNLGEHSAEILREFDYTDDAIAKLLAPSGVCAPAAI